MKLVSVGDTEHLSLACPPANQLRVRDHEEHTKVLEQVLQEALGTLGNLCCGRQGAV